MPELKNEHMAEVRRLTYDLTGITLNANKDVMIKNRIDKLLRHLGMGKDVNRLLKEVADGDHREIFINSFTTNKTDFFREGVHFEDLKDRVLPELFAKKLPARIYCAASSTGEEPYTIAMTVRHAQKKRGAAASDVKILATDIDTDVLARAKEGIFRFAPDQNPFPEWIRPPEYFSRRLIEGDHRFLIRAKENLRSLLAFDTMNLMSPAYPFKAAEFDVIFCRNVLIYFSQADQNAILKKLFRHLKIGGTLYLGHSESPLDLSGCVRREGRNIFIKTKEA